MKNSKSPEVLNEYFQLKIAISSRIETLETFYDDNLNNPRYLTLEKGIIKLKRLLFYYPDANNELEEPDIPSFRGLVIDAKHIPNYSKGSNQKGNPRTKVTTPGKDVENGLQSPMKKKGNEKNKRGQVLFQSVSAAGKTGYKTIKENKENSLKSESETKKIIKVRLSADEYKLLEKLKAKRMLTVK